MEASGSHETPTTSMPSSATQEPQQSSHKVDANRLPIDWSSAKDSVSGREYFVNAKTKETTWTLPTAANDVKEADIDLSQVSLHDDRRMNDSTMPPPPSRNTTVAAAPASHSALTSCSSNVVSDKPSTLAPTRKTINTTKTKPSTSNVTAPAPPPRNRRRFGLGDWTLLLQSSNDLAMRKGAPLRKFKWKEIRQHSSKHDGWVVIRNKVFFISPYLAYHPGGEAILCKCLGKDATALYDKYHQWVNLEALIGKLQIGYLDTSSSDDDSEDDGEQEAGMSLPEHLALARRMS